jgi:hypothetical protein
MTLAAAHSSPKQFMHRYSTPKPGTFSEPMSISIESLPQRKQTAGAASARATSANGRVGRFGIRAQPSSS